MYNLNLIMSDKPFNVIINRLMLNNDISRQIAITLYVEKRILKKKLEEIQNKWFV